jgi:phosphatidylserine decarboxylase
MAMIIVGALNVGSIVLNFDELVRTNVKFSERPSRKAFARSYSHVEEVK